MSYLSDAWLQLALSLSRDEYVSTANEPLRTIAYDAGKLRDNLSQEWRLSAYPCVTLDDKLAASLVMTKLPAELDDAAWPWETFLVTLPEFVAESIGGLSGYREAGVFLTRSSGAIAVAIVVVTWNRWARRHEPSVIFSATYKTLAQLCEKCETESDHVGQSVMRIMVGAFCELNSKPDGDTSVGSPPGPSKRTGLPRVWNFKISRPVAVDCRQSAKEFVRTGKPGPFIQRLVRGHWQRYHVGPRGNQRCVMKHKEPYWQGNEDAPIALHSHALSGAQP